MDVLAHTLWTNALFHLKYHQQRRLRYLAAFFGVVPDLVGFAPVFVYLILSGRIFSGKQFPFAATNWTFDFAEQGYNYTHSLVIFAATFLVVLVLGNLYKYFKNKPLYRFWFFWPMLGWGLHILIDFPTHPDFYHTPIFFPLSEYQFTGGISWAHPIFMAINYSLLIAAYIGIYIYQKRKYGTKV
jgi:membrane-bound metal-dependent hydrolase YbcI (DUF457 family)